jgi:septal ring factor EnvC (AmiA/AmiB activator)
LGGSIAERYERARKALEEGRAAEDKTRGERDRIVGEAQSLQQKLIENAARVQTLEADSATIQKQLDALEVKAAALQADFTKNRATVAHLLAVLQRLNADAPPALALEPSDSLSAARGAMQLGAMLPPVYQKAADLGRQLREIVATRKALAEKRREGETTAADLKNARAQLSELLAAKGQERQVAETKLVELSDVTNAAGREASDLKSLIDRISTLRRQDDSAASSGMVVVKAEANAPALARNSLLHPVVGDFKPGDPAGPGVTPGVGTEGLWFAAGPGAQTVAPGDGEVIFAGPYQKFGQVLILEIAGGYDLLLAGLGRIDVHIGDLVLAGEPVGVLPGSSAGSKADDTAALYLELRRGGQTVNPVPWMSTEIRKAKRS